MCVGVKDTEFSLRVASNGNGTAATAKMMSTDTDISRLADNGKVMDLVMASSAWVSGPSAAASSNSNSTARVESGHEVSILIIVDLVATIRTICSPERLVSGINLPRTSSVSLV